MSDDNHEGDKGEKLVEIKINKNDYKVRPGQYTVAKLKQIGGVPAADELEQLIHGKLTPLPDDGSVTIKGGEKFASHPRDGGSS